MLNINILKDGGKAVYSLEGRLDTSTAPQLEEAVNGNISEREVRNPARRGRSRLVGVRRQGRGRTEDRKACNGG